MTKRIKSKLVPAMVKHAANALIPSWQYVWTASQAEQELSGFKFEGPGWYFQTKDTMLVIPANRKQEEIWNKKFSDDERFYFYCWNNYNPADDFNSIANATTRMDEQ